jgi:lambda family phage portal protein
MNYLRRVSRAAGFLGRTVMGVGFEGASQAPRLRGWKETDAAINALLQSEGDELRRRSRGLVRKNHWARCAQDSYVSNTIGTGIKPQSLHPDPGVRKQLHELWLRWTDEADSDGTTDFYGLQAVALREMFEAGEVIARFRPRYASDGPSVPLQLQLIEAEHVPLTKFGTNGENPIRAGIEFTPYGKRAAYWIHPEHPGLGAFALNVGGNEPKRVPADSVLHCFHGLRAGQYRGAPWLAPVMVTLYELDQFIDAVLVRQKLANMFVGVEKIIGEDASVFLPTNPETDPNQEDVGYGEIQGGTILRPDAGKEIEWSNPPAPASSLPDFVKMMLHAYASGVGLPYTLINWDSSDTNYSSMRGELLECRRRIEQLQWGCVIFQFCRPTHRRWINDAVIAGKLPKPRNQQEWDWLYATRWRTPKWAWVDQLKEVLAAKELVRCSFGSHSGVIHELGDDPEQVAADIAADNELHDRLGIVSDADPRNTANNGAAQAAQQAEQAQEPGGANDQTRKVA